MRMSALLLIAGIGIAANASAATPRVSDGAKREAASMTTAAPSASASAAARNTGDGAKASLSMSGSKETSKGDPYAVPLFKDAKQLH